MVSGLIWARFAQIWHDDAVLCHHGDMLATFSAKNFRSFKDEATLDLRAPRGRAPGARPWDGNILPVVAIYGANASGKTTLFKAMASMAHQVKRSYIESRVEAEPFIFDADSPREPTEFTATFVSDADNRCYAYGFGVLDGAVVSEWADLYATGRPTRLFTRDATGIKFGAALKGPNQAVARTVRPASLYLSAAGAAEHPGLAPIWYWFAHQLRTYAAGGHGSRLKDSLALLTSDEGLRKQVIGVLGRADLGLDGVEYAEVEADPKEREVYERLRSALASVPELTGMAPPPPKRKLGFGVHSFGAVSYRLPIFQESEGTRAMLSHALVTCEALATGATAVFDEIDASLHPLLLRRLVEVFQDSAANPRQAQMIFTTHDVSLMDAGSPGGSRLGRDEVWVTEKDGAGRSTLAPVADYRPRERDNLARRYLSGRFGGVPQPAPLVQPALS
ncbi:MAG: AAA family ATPase [Bifidobacteriaceae bacterium]|jgi:energy-coupling factor transporter ATP-binding protein EcfA2|nr:AAA family ATPase [Bifidobacteriaceae bacterium]